MDVGAFAGTDCILRTSLSNGLCFNIQKWTKNVRYSLQDIR